MFSLCHKVSLQIASPVSNDTLYNLLSSLFTSALFTSIMLILSLIPYFSIYWYVDNAIMLFSLLIFKELVVGWDKVGIA